MRLVQRVRTSASPAQVWEVLGNPARWPECELWLRRVRGAQGTAVTGQTLVGVARVASLRVPIDVLEAEPGRRLVLRVHALPGVVETVGYELLPVVRGGTDIRAGVVVDGLFAPSAVLPLWLSTGLTARVLAVRAERLARAVRRVA